MNVTLWLVANGPWSGQDGADTAGFRAASDILQVIEHRLQTGDATADDRTRYRIAAATIERTARDRGRVLAVVDGEDFMAWLDGEPLRTIFAPDAVAGLRARLTVALDGSGQLGEAVFEALDIALAERAGIVLTATPQIAGSRVTAPSRPTRPVAARTIVPAPDLAAAIAQLPHSADLVFDGDRFRLAAAGTLRRQLRSAIESGEPLSVGSQAKHDVLTEVIRELHHPDAPAGAVRMMYATEGEEGSPLRFRPLGEKSESGVGPAHPVRLAMMSMRHTELDAEVDGYWFRNRLVSVTGRSQAAAEAYCHRDSVVRLRRMIERGVTDLFITHTGFEPAVLGFYRAVAEVVSEHDLRVHPRYHSDRGTRHGTSWPGGIDPR